jgi:cell division protease FtsH
MSEKLGPLTFGRKDENPFLGREFGNQRDYSEHTAIEIDAEVRRIVTAGYDLAMKLVNENIDKLKAVAEALLEHESLDGAQVDRVIAGEKLPPMQKPATRSGSASRKPKSIFGTQDKAGVVGTPKISETA